MPWRIEKTDRCPATKPYGVIKETDGTLEGCHPSQSAARAQQAALYASEGLRTENMQHKEFRLLSTKTDGEEGVFTALVSTFGNVDKVGDRILPGAWTKSLEQWQQSGDPVPIILAHQWNDPMAHIGIAKAEDIVQTDQGLQVTAKLDVEDNPVAKQVYRLMKRRSLKEFSIGYTVPKNGERRAKDGANDISEIHLAECGPCLKGIDPKTELQAVKSALGSQVDPAELRRRADVLEREMEERRLPDVPPVDPEPERESEAEPVPVPDAEDLRKRALRAERELEESRLPDIKQQPSGGLQRVVNSMLGQCREFLAAEPSTEDAALMRDVMDALQSVSGGGGKARLFSRRVHEDELSEDILKAVWSAAYVNSLPDSSFLYIEPGGSKDSEGKTTPRSLRYFPVKDANGNVDLAHLRNALARIPQSNLPQAVKDRCTASAERMLNANKADETPKEPNRVRGVDPLRARADAEALEFASGGESLRKPPQTQKAPAPQPEVPLKVLKQRMRDEMLTALSGGTINE